MVECNWVSSENQSSEPIKQKDTLDRNNLATPVFPNFTTEDVNKINCGYCDSRHKKGKEFCPAWNKMCRKCHRINHFASACKTKEENYLRRNRSKSSAQETIRMSGTEINSEEKNDRYSQCEWKKVEKSRTFKRNKSESDLKTLETSTPTDVAWIRNDKSASSYKKRNIPSDLEAKYVQENGLGITQRSCSWCSRKTSFKCNKCSRHYCSRRCSFSDPLHNSYDSCSYENFCVLCAENQGHCNLHTVSSEESNENAQSVEKRRCDNYAY